MSVKPKFLCLEYFLHFSTVFGHGEDDKNIFTQIFETKNFRVSTPWFPEAQHASRFCRKEYVRQEYRSRIFVMEFRSRIFLKEFRSRIYVKEFRFRIKKSQGKFFKL